MKSDVLRSGLLACACVASGAIWPGATSAAGDKTSPPAFPIPASARVHGTPATAASHTTAAPAFPIPASARVHSTTPATTVAPDKPTTAAPPASVPANGAAPQGGIPTPGAGATHTPSVAPPTALGGAAARATRSHGRSSTRLSTGAIVGAAIAGILVLLCLVWAAVRWLAIEPRWTRSLAYSLEEASFRASATWAELLDWARLGR